MSESVRILFVCMGNICRSPAAEGILKHFVQQDPSLNIYVESCGIGNWHVGHPPDWRMQEASKLRGIPLLSRAQQFQMKFFDHFDYILAADKEVLRDLYRFALTPEQKNKVALMTSFSFHYKGEEVPDPYYRGDPAFEIVLDMLEDSCRGLIDYIKSSQSKS
jgi:protein-tyrosine phosphatase